MRTIITVLRKELLSTLRDKKTIFSTILLPALAMPLLIFGIIRLQVSQMEKQRTQELKVALFNAPDGVEDLFAPPAYVLVSVADPMAARDSVAAESLDAVLVFDPAFTEQVRQLRSGRAEMYYKSTSEQVEKRISEQLALFERDLVLQRLDQLQFDAELLEPIVVEKLDVASAKEQIGMAMGGFLPYLFIIFCFTGCMYPALDMITGEKEKGTIETLLTVPASRFQILLGKMFAIALIGIIAALVAIGSLVATVQLATELPPIILAAISDILSIRFVLMLFAMLIPLSLFFAGLISAIAIRAESFKEAQSYVTPLMFVAILPAMVALMPGIKLTWGTAFIPILNIALATKEIIAGTIDPAMFAVILLSLVLLAFLAVMASKGQFSKEGNILK